jgi:hypothetical protein
MGCATLQAINQKSTIIRWRRAGVLEELRILFYSISVFTSIILMSDWTKMALAASVLAVLIIHGICLGVVLQWGDARSLFGTKNYELSRHYSTKTTHVHRLNTFSPSNSDPSHWESLGLIIPASDEQEHVQKFKIGNYNVQPYKDLCENRTSTSACWLEHNYGDYVFLNGESMSIISQISPSVYFATLLTVYLLSSIPLVSNFLARYLKPSCFPSATENFIEKCIRYVVILVVLAMYFFGLLLAYGASSFVNETKILDIEVRYTISSHLASIIPCTITIFIYLLHLRGRNLNWADDTYGVVPADDNIGLASAVVEGTTFTPVVNYPSSNTALANVHGVYFVSGSAMQIMKGTEAGFFERVLSRVTPIMESAVKDAHPGGHFYYGPNSSEASVIGALTVFLGGIGSLGLSRGIIPEVQVQLILGCTLGFALLEVCSHRLQAYFNFMFGQLLNFEVSSPDIMNTGTSYMLGVRFIRFVILCLQLWLLVLYNSIIVDLELQSSTLQRVLYALFILYWVAQFSMWIDIFDKDWFTMCCGMFGSDSKGVDPRTRRLDIRMSLEFGFCFIAFFVFIIALSSIIFDETLQQDDQLVKYEKIQYDLSEVAPNTKCGVTGTFSKSSLVHSEIKRKDGEITWKTTDSWTADSRVDPVELKVYFWTKGWNVQLIKDPSFGAWFCTNGLEHHWGQCLHSPYYCGMSHVAEKADIKCDAIVATKVGSMYNYIGG